MLTGYPPDPAPVALLYIDSFDHYDTSHILSKWTSAFTMPSVLTGQGRCGTNCLKMSTFNDLHKGLVFGSASCTVGFAAKVIQHNTATFAAPPLLRLGSSDGGIHLSLVYYAFDGSLAVIRTKHASSTNPDVLGRTPPDVIRQDSWYFLELKATIAASGSIALRVNNVEWLSASGVYTIGDTASNTPMVADLRYVGFTCPSNCEWYFDDLYILDSTGAAPWNTFLGDCRVEYLRPRAAGTAQAWSVVGAPSHFVAVDDIATPDDDTSYLTTTTAGATDTQLYRPTGLPSGPIYGAQLSLLSRKTDNGPRMLAPVIRQGGTEHVGGSQAPSANLPYHYVIQTYQVNPITSAPWTIAEINADEYGVKVTE